MSSRKGTNLKVVAGAVVTEPRYEEATQGEA
jgi:hypothetical protein